MAKSIMIQGAGSNVGKSMIVAGICRAAANQGLRVTAFKPQNMSNNAAVTIDGGEIGRAQALQAMACNRDPVTDMNPILLKPETDVGAQVIVQGKRLTTLKARDYAKLRPRLMPAVMESFNRLGQDSDLIIVEGAGSPAEINLRAGDIANMGFAQTADIPVIMVGDIDRGGVIAQMAGTYTILPPQDRDRIKAFIINKFRGDVTLFDDGLQFIETFTNWANLGVLPWFKDAQLLPAEDAVDIAIPTGAKGFKIAVPMLSRIANFDDLDPLQMDPTIDLVMVRPGHPLPLDADLIIIPGSKSTIGDLEFFKAQGWDIDLNAHARKGGHILGVCGGYQMLGRAIHDPNGIEGPAGSIQGLGLLDVETVMENSKRLAKVSGTFIETGDPVQGYEIHIGVTHGQDCARAWLQFDTRNEGASSLDGRVMGCYVHGLFYSDLFRANFLKRLGHTATSFNYGKQVDQTLNDLAAHIEQYLTMDQLLALAK